MPPLLLLQEQFRRDCNTGGPRSRTRTQEVYKTVLGKDSSRVSLDSVTRVALDFGESDPFTAVQALMSDVGIRGAEALRWQYDIPDEPCICRETTLVKPLVVGEADADKVLRQVAILSLCTPYHFDPRRPVLLTRAALTRSLELFSGKGFYA